MYKIGDKELDEFTMAYIETLLRDVDENEKEHSQRTFYVEDLADETLQRVIDDCNNFRDDFEELLARAGDDGENGYNFWMDRVGAGVGFWDREYDVEVVETLSNACGYGGKYGHLDPYVGDDGKVYLA